MLKRVLLGLDSLHPETWTTHDVEDVCAFLKEQFGDKFPDTGKIYDRVVTQATDVTPYDEITIQRLQELEGPLFIVVYPGWVALPYIIGALLAVAGLLLVKPNVPQPPTATERNNQVQSPNNGLSDRTNTARINARIPDIYGTVRSTPDLLSAPYKIFQNNREVEYAYMCIGRGEYEISDVRDGDTLIANIPGSSAIVYGPYNSPNNYDPNFPDDNAPQLTIGTLVRSPVLSVKRSNSVNGQVLRPPNTAAYVGTGNVRFRAPNLIELPPTAVDDFTKYFVDGDTIVISDGSMTSGSAVTQRIVCRTTSVDLVQEHSPTSKTYSTSGGSLVFETNNSVETALSVTQALFVVGATIIISTIKEASRSGLAGYLDGSYVISDVSLQGPNNSTEQSWNAPTLFVVKLTSASSVNAHWGSLDTSGGIKTAYEFTLDVTMPASASYNLDLDGTYVAVAVTSNGITLDDPVSVNSDWSIVATHVVTPYLSPTLTATGDKWIGPFILEDVNLIEIYSNFFASNGLYTDDGTTQTGVSIDLQLEATPVDSSDEATGAAEVFQITLQGSSFLKESVAITLSAHPSTFQGRCAIRARRVTESDDSFTGTVVDEVVWRDAYSVAQVAASDFGNVTTVFSVTYATASALAVKERKLNMLVQRKLPQPTVDVDGNIIGFTNALTGTNNAAFIIFAVCRDRYIGNRQLAEIDIPNIMQALGPIGDVATYFGDGLPIEFCYTFDDNNISFEETVQAIANACFCVAYRRGNVIKLSFEQQTIDSTLLFNHRNKVPGSEHRTINFGFLDDNDGIEYIYVNPADDSVISIFLPQDYPATNSKKVQSVGVRNHLQAYFQAWRTWNKIQYQNTQVEFDATQEADLLITNDRILVADNTRTLTQDGEIIAWDSAFTLTLSQIPNLTVFGSYVIHLQHYDGTVGVYDITAGPEANQVVLGTAPALPPVTDNDSFAKTTYTISGEFEDLQTAFLVTEKTATNGLTATVNGINYSDNYYLNDLDFINGIITEQGYGPGGGFVSATGSPYPSTGADPQTINITSALSFSSPFNGTWETDTTGYCSPESPEGSGGSTDLTSLTKLTETAGLVAVGLFNSTNLLFVLEEGLSLAQDYFTSLTITKTGGVTHTYNSADATFDLLNTNGSPGGDIPTWIWSGASADFVVGVVTSIVVTY